MVFHLVLSLVEMEVSHVYNIFEDVINVFSILSKLK